MPVAPNVLANCRRSRDKLRQRLLDAFGGYCAVCGFNDPRALQLDHIQGGGTKARKKINAEAIWRQALALPEEKRIATYQLLCANCNWIQRVITGACKHNKRVT